MLVLCAVVLSLKYKVHSHMGVAEVRVILESFTTLFSFGVGAVGESGVIVSSCFLASVGSQE